jgi:hypothetical protein
MFYVQIFLEIPNFHRDKWVPVNVAWCVLRLQMEEQFPV